MHLLGAGLQHLPGVRQFVGEAKHNVRTMAQMLEKAVTGGSFPCQTDDPILLCDPNFRAQLVKCSIPRLCQSVFPSC
jgi:hypothetical protein